MKIRPKTPRTEMVHSALIAKMGEFYKALGQELGVGSEAVDKELTRFAALSARTEPESKGEIDFELAVVTDTPEQIREKFMVYIDTKCYGVVDAAMDGILIADRPITPLLQQPTPPKESEKN